VLKIQTDLGIYFLPEMLTCQIQKRRFEEIRDIKKIKVL